MVVSYYIATSGYAGCVDTTGNDACTLLEACNPNCGMRQLRVVKGAYNMYFSPTVAAIHNPKMAAYKDLICGDVIVPRGQISWA